MERTWRAVRAGARPIEPLLTRERLVDAMRAFFKGRGFREVETPLLVRHPGMETHLEVFATELCTTRGRRAAAYLTTSPEYAMKKLLAAGLERIFQICKAFRNGEETSAGHNPEFTILEWYRAHADYTVLMSDCEELLLALVGGRSATYQGKTIDLTPPWPRISVREAFREYAGVEPTALGDREALALLARERGYDVEPGTTWEQLYHQIFLNEVEPRLPKDRPVFLYDYPVALAALARPKPGEPDYAERFELYVGGVELANAFSELTDPVEQRRRLETERAERCAGGKTLYDIDEDFVQAVGGMPPSAGIALGVDRLVMLLADVPSIRDVLWFPADEMFGAG